jgi:hypothetical protein
VFRNMLPGNDSFVAIRYSGNVISEPLPSNGRLLRLHHFGFQPSCHNIIYYLPNVTLHNRFTNFFMLRIFMRPPMHATRFIDLVLLGLNILKCIS